jgi:NAD+ diphosphatase
VFVPAVRPPESLSERSVWFAFQGDRLLVVPAETEAGLPAWRELEDLGASPSSAHYLGRLEDADCFALDIGAENGELRLPDGRSLEGLRALYGRLPENLFSLAGRAAQILEWDRTHRFCGRCGAPTQRMQDERARRCPACQLLAYPRLSPAVIMLVRRGDDILLGRNAARGTFWSVLAGFVEPGESLEEAVTREVREEVGVEIRDLRYFGSQPWPFPHQLMIGFTANYASGEINVDSHELLEARWFPRHRLPEQIPSRISIARRLIDSACA